VAENDPKPRRRPVRIGSAWRRLYCHVRYGLPQYIALLDRQDDWRAVSYSVRK
jgi:hypothetical protein